MKARDMIRVLTFNIPFIPKIFKPGGIGDHSGRLRALTEYLLDQRFDIVVLNEMFIGTYRTTLAHQASRYFDTFTGIGSTGFGGLKVVDSGLVLMVNRATVTVRSPPAFKRYVACDTFDCHADKGIAHVEAQIDKRAIHVFFTHMQSDERFKKEREHQLGTIHTFMQDVLPHIKPEPWLLAGDLNIIGGDPEYKNMLKILGNPHDAWTDTNPTAPGYTIHDKNHWVSGGKPQRLDYVLFNPEKSALRCRTCTVNEMKGISGYPTNLSDHFAVECKFEW